MIPKLDQKPLIQDTLRSSSPVPTSSVPAQTRRSPKTMRRSSKKGEQRTSSNSPVPPLRRHDSMETCSSIDSTMEIPSAIVTVSAPLHAQSTTTGGGSGSSSRSASPVPAAARVTPSSTPRSTSKAVCFNKRVRIRKIKRLEDLTQEEIEATYFSDQELVNIRNGLRANIRSMVESNYRENQHETVDDYERPESAFCVRGLEHEFPQGKFRRKQLKMMSRGAVLEEQRLQRQFCVGRHALQGEDSINSVTASGSAKSLNSSSNHSTMTASTCDSTIHSFGPGGYHTINEDADIAISEIYRIESKPAVQLALEFAKRDEAIADQIYFAHQAI